MDYDTMKYLGTVSMIKKAKITQRLIRTVVDVNRGSESGPLEQTAMALLKLMYPTVGQKCTECCLRCTFWCR